MPNDNQALSTTLEVAQAVNSVTPSDSYGTLFLVVLILSLSAFGIVALIVLKPVILKKLGGGMDENPTPPSAVGRALQDIDRFMTALGDVKQALQELEREQKQISKAQADAERDIESSRIDAQQTREDFRQFREEMRDALLRIHDRIDKLRDGK